MDLSGSDIRQSNQRQSHRKMNPDRPQSFGYPSEPQFPQQRQMYDPMLQQQQQQQQNAAAYYASSSGYGHMQPEDYYDYGSGGNVPGQNFINDPMASMAMAYGQSLVGQGKQIVDQKLDKYVPVSKIKYYFAVDTSYVRRKLTLVLFPFANSDWSIKYQQEEPIAPRYEANAPDLYIPAMALVTFILVAGLALGTQNKFSPEQLGIQASSVFGWLILEIVVLSITTYIANIQTDLGYLDFLAFCSYKYVGMIGCVLSGMAFFSLGYYLTFMYMSGALCFFLVKTLRIQILPKSSPDMHPSHGNKRRLYLLLFIAAVQPFIMFLLTRHLVPTTQDVVGKQETF